MSIEILAYEETPLGILCLRRRSLVSKPEIEVTEVTLNHEFLMSSYLTESERALSYFGLSGWGRANADKNLGTTKGKPGNLKAMVGGLGLGYTAMELLQSDLIAAVEVVEFLPQVIDWTKTGLTPLAEQLNSDPRLSITNADVYAKLGASGNNDFDLILIDVDHSPEDVLGEQSNQFYSSAGMEIAKSHLKPGGVIGIWSYAEYSPLIESMKEAFSDVSVESVTVFNDLIHEDQTDWLFFGVN
ncbi:MAG: hypothetical protein AB8B55_11280 [Mariniblastus sp.]